MDGKTRRTTAHEPGEDRLREHDRGGGADQDAAEMFDPGGRSLSAWPPRMPR
jgi:hypothetical protein